MVKSIISDVDNVVLNYNDQFNDYIQTKYGKSINYLSYSFCTQTGLPESIYEEFASTNPLLPLMDPQIPELYNYIYSHFQMYFVSRYSNMNNRIDNLSHYHIPYNYLVLTENKLSYFLSIKPSYILEDDPWLLNAFVDKLDNDSQYRILEGVTIFVPNVWPYCNGKIKESRHHRCRIIYYDQISDIKQHLDPFDHNEHQ